MRNTKQRECVLNIVNNSYEHLSAYQIYDMAREIIPNISLGTVYRNLSWLSMNNYIRFLIVNGMVRYDRNDIHDHFVCTNCGAIIDVLRKDVVNGYIDGNLVVDYEIKYRGICSECQRKGDL